MKDAPPDLMGDREHIRNLEIRLQLVCKRAIVAEKRLSAIQAIWDSWDGLDSPDALLDRIGNVLTDCE